MTGPRSFALWLSGFTRMSRTLPTQDQWDKIINKLEVAMNVQVQDGVYAASRCYSSYQRKPTGPRHIDDEA